jgi:hypothetical protein
LLSDDGAKKRLRPALAVARLRHAMLLQHASERRFAVGEGFDVTLDALLGTNHQFVLAA